ncbi:hypothetical protein A2Z00_01010 [Candidatus Gottesmanbacteria bacterium RBG_13_45_10]|uniref:Fimbrial assembly protein n=1 Tax=Candidatus Gottesmanbacteria bacterium RBG_13_45_10 TaxID=1798370 RepID=A0A1F5ZH10_9BACT|nr:MAG: hypothetical protein A2Z00_01010 [Candidatus Gottesmanbacteria bacterium RBG_13_45_10]
MLLAFIHDMPAKDISINLLGESQIEHTPLGRIINWAVTYGRYIMIGTEIVVLLAFISRFSLDRKLTDLKEEVAQKQDILEANASFEKDVRALQDKLARIKTLSQGQSTPVDVLVLFQSITPPGVYLDAFDLSNRGVSAQAIAGDTTSFSQFIANLQAANKLTNVDFGDIKRDPLLGIQFGLSAHIVGQKPTPTK